MATRREVQQRTQRLQSELRAACRAGEIAAGEMAPSSRELAARYGVSHMAAARALQELVEEGVLYSVPRVGTFAGTPPTPQFEYYLLLLHKAEDAQQQWYWQFRIGFEEMMSQRGGATLEMDAATFEAHRQRDDLPQFAGVFDTASCPDARPFWATKFPDSPIPHARFGVHNEDWPSYDTISFDDIEGGQRAALHLLEQGHEHIAFLGPHHPAHYNTHLGWSNERAAGWQNALERAGVFAPDLLFHPAQPLSGDSATYLEPLTQAALRLVKRRDIGAVVAASALATQAIFAALQDVPVPRERWPAIVTFDDEAMAHGRHLSALRLPWEELGRCCASLLWERRHGRLDAAPQHRQVSMRLIARLTSQPNWPRAAGHATLVGNSAARARSLATTSA